MHKRFVANVVSRVGIVVCLVMFWPLGWALYDNSHSREAVAFAETILIGLAVSIVLLAIFRFKKNEFKKINAKDGLAIVGLSWIYLSVLGALPLYLSGVTATYVDAFFEITSGFTTTGASIFADVEVLPRGILFWRSLTQWLGGMGIIVLYIALLPALGANAYQLYKAEAPGVSLERIEPRIKETAKSLWAIYFMLSIIEVALLFGGGMTFFDALCHTFSTMATGGFSTRNASIGAYSPYIQWVVIIFMFLAGTNFIIHYQLMRGRPKVLKYNEEFKIYLLLVITMASFFAATLFFAQSSTDPIRDSAFQVVSTITTTGFITTDFDVWPAPLRFAILLLMIIGGCGGSTAGGMKLIRFFIGIKVAFRSIVQTLFPNVIMPIKVDDKSVPQEVINAVMSYFIIFMFLFLTGALLFSIVENADIETSLSASITCLSNVGPGLSKVGPMQNYAWISSPGKMILVFLMLAGRLELYAMLVLLNPITWRK